MLARNHSGKTEVALVQNKEKLLTDLTSSETDHVLNSVFLLQSLMKKDFGLKVTDIRNMQSHDKKLALELAKLETMDQEQRRASKFKISQGILYHSSQKDDSMQLCVMFLFGLLTLF